MSKVYKNSSRTPSVAFFKAFVSFVRFRFSSYRKDKTGHFRHALDLLEHLSGDYPVRTFIRLKATNFARQALDEEQYLPTLLSKTNELKALPKNSLGRLYYELNEGKEDIFTTLSSHMYIEKYTDEYSRFLRRNFSVHDMVHLVMGFDRSSFGEANVGVALSHGGASPHWKNLFLMPLVFSKIFEGKWEFFRLSWKIIFSETPKRCEAIDNWDLIHWETLLNEDIDQIRKEMKIPEAVLYSPKLFFIKEDLVNAE